MAQRTATGFVMRETSVEGLREALGRAMRTCAQPPLFNAMRQAAMRQPLDWTASAQAYAARSAASPSGVVRPGRLCGLARRAAWVAVISGGLAAGDPYPSSPRHLQKMAVR